MGARQIIAELKKKSSKKNRAGMARFGISPKKALGVSVVNIRKIAKKYPRDHALAQQLWETGIHEARILATIIDDPKAVTEEQMEAWAKGFDSWDICDQACMNLFDKTPMAWTKAVEWANRGKEFEKRAGFALMASLAVHDKTAFDNQFNPFFDEIKQHAGDERNFVKKAVNWALRQIGKRNDVLKKRAIHVAKEIERMDSKSAKWVAKDALRELEREKVTRKFL